MSELLPIAEDLMIMPSEIEVVRPGGSGGDGVRSPSPNCYAAWVASLN